jgi:hypothetical protein
MLDPREISSETEIKEKAFGYGVKPSPVKTAGVLPSGTMSNADIVTEIRIFLREFKDINPEHIKIVTDFSELLIGRINPWFAPLGLATAVLNLMDDLRSGFDPHHIKELNHHLCQPTENDVIAITEAMAHFLEGVGTRAFGKESLEHFLEAVTSPPYDTDLDMLQQPDF